MAGQFDIKVGLDPSAVIAGLDRIAAKADQVLARINARAREASAAVNQGGARPLPVGTAKREVLTQFAGARPASGTSDAEAKRFEQQRKSLESRYLRALERVVREAEKAGIQVENLSGREITAARSAIVAELRSQAQVAQLGTRRAQQAETQLTAQQAKRVQLGQETVSGAQAIAATTRRLAGATALGAGQSVQAITAASIANRGALVASRQVADSQRRRARAEEAAAQIAERQVRITPAVTQAVAPTAGIPIPAPPPRRRPAPGEDLGFFPDPKPPKEDYSRAIALNERRRQSQYLARLKEALAVPPKGTPVRSGPEALDRLLAEFHAVRRPSLDDVRAGHPTHGIDGTRVGSVIQVVPAYKKEYAQLTAAEELRRKIAVEEAQKLRAIAESRALAEQEVLRRRRNLAIGAAGVALPPVRRDALTAGPASPLSLSRLPPLRQIASVSESGLAAPRSRSLSSIFAELNAAQSQVVASTRQVAAAQKERAQQLRLFNQQELRRMQVKPGDDVVGHRGYSPARMRQVREIFEDKISIGAGFGGQFSPFITGTYPDHPAIQKSPYVRGPEKPGRRSEDFDTPEWERNLDEYDNLARRRMLEAIARSKLDVEQFRGVPFTIDTSETKEKFAGRYHPPFGGDPYHRIEIAGQSDLEGLTTRKSVLRAGDRTELTLLHELKHFSDTLQGLISPDTIQTRRGEFEARADSSAIRNYVPFAITEGRPDQRYRYGYDQGLIGERRQNYLEQRYGAQFASQYAAERVPFGRQPGGRQTALFSAATVDPGIAEFRKLLAGAFAPQAALNAGPSRLALEAARPALEAERRRDEKGRYVKADGSGGQPPPPPRTPPVTGPSGDDDGEKAAKKAEEARKKIDAQAEAQRRRAEAKERKRFEETDPDFLREQGAERERATLTRQEGKYLEHLTPEDAEYARQLRERGIHQGAINAVLRERVNEVKEQHRADAAFHELAVKRLQRQADPEGYDQFQDIQRRRRAAVQAEQRQENILQHAAHLDTYKPKELLDDSRNRVREARLGLLRAILDEEAVTQADIDNRGQYRALTKRHAVQEDAAFNRALSEDKQYAPSVQEAITSKAKVEGQIAAARTPGQLADQTDSLQQQKLAQLRQQVVTNARILGANDQQLAALSAAVTAETSVAKLKARIAAQTVQQQIAQANLVTQTEIAAKAQLAAIKTRQGAQENAAYKRALSQDPVYINATNEQKAAAAAIEGNVAATRTPRQIEDITAGAHQTKLANLRQQVVANARILGLSDLEVRTLSKNVSTEQDIGKLKAQTKVQAAQIDLATRKKVQEEAKRVDPSTLSEPLKGGRVSRFFQTLSGRGGGGGFGGGRGGGILGGDDGGDFDFTEFFGKGALTTLRYAVPGALLYGSLRTVKELVTEAEKLELAMGQLERQFIATGRGDQFAGARKAILDISEETGQSALATVALYQRFQGLFGRRDPNKPQQSNKDIQRNVDKEVRAASQLALVTGIPEETLKDSVAAIAVNFGDFNRAVGEEAKSGALAIGTITEAIGNLAVTAESQFGVAAAELINFLGDIAPVANEAGFSLAEFGAIGAVALQTSGRNAAAIAESFGRILPRLQQNMSKILAIPGLVPEGAEGDKILRSAFQGDRSNSGLPDVSQLFFQIRRQYKGLGAADKAALQEALGGTRETQNILGVLNAPDAQFNEAVQKFQANQTEGVLGGRAAQRAEALKTQLDKLTATLRKFGDALFRLGLADILKSILALLAPFKVFTDLLSAIADFNDRLGGIPTKILGIVAALKLLQAVAQRGFGIGALAGLAGRFGGGSAAAAAASAGGQTYLGGGRLGLPTMLGKGAGGLIAKAVPYAAPLVIGAALLQTVREQEKQRNNAVKQELGGLGDKELKERVKSAETTFARSVADPTADFSKAAKAAREVKQGKKEIDQRAVRAVADESTKARIEALREAGAISQEKYDILIQGLNEGDRVILDQANKYLADAGKGKHGKKGKKGYSQGQKDVKDLNRGITAATRNLSSEEAGVLFQASEISFQEYTAVMVRDIKNLERQVKNGDQNKQTRIDLAKKRKELSDTLLQNAQQMLQISQQFDELSGDKDAAATVDRIVLQAKDKELSPEARQQLGRDALAVQKTELAKDVGRIRDPEARYAAALQRQAADARARALAAEGRGGEDIATIGFTDDELYQLKEDADRGAVARLDADSALAGVILNDSSLEIARRAAEDARRHAREFRAKGQETEARQADVQAAQQDKAAAAAESRRKDTLAQIALVGRGPIATARSGLERAQARKKDATNAFGFKDIDLDLAADLDIANENERIRQAVISRRNTDARYNAVYRQQRAVSGPRPRSARAREDNALIEVRQAVSSAQQNLNEAIKQKRDSEEISDLRFALFEAQRAERSALRSYADSEDALFSAQNPRNRAEILRRAVISAKRNVLLAKANGDPIEVNNTMAALATAQEEQNQYFRDLADSEDKLFAAQNSRNRLAILGRAVAAAQKNLVLARSDGDLEKINLAAAALADAQEGINQYIREGITLAENYLIADLTGRGLIVEAANERVKQAQRQAADARSTGDPNTIRAAEITVKEMQYALRDAQLQDTLSDLDFQRDMNEITIGQMISLLNAQLENTELTKQQKQSIRQKIKSLKDDLGKDLQFNLPTEIGLPTLYEARRLNQSGAESSSGRYQDNRVQTVTLYINNGMDQAAAQQFLSDSLGTSSSQFGVTPRRY